MEEEKNYKKKILKPLYSALEVTYVLCVTDTILTDLGTAQ